MMRETAMKVLQNYLEGRWQTGQGQQALLTDPVLGTPLACVSAQGLDVAAGYAWARQQGGPALRELTYAQRAGLLTQIVQVLKANRDKYYDISLQNSGTVANDTAIDVDGSFYTLSHYARLGASLPDTYWHLEGASSNLAKDGSFCSQHMEVPIHGLALLINAFNFPAWGLWEKAAPALLSGVPVVVKPASSTAWLTHEMARDVIAANILPAGALSLICGHPGLPGTGLLDALEPLDVVSFTGSAQTAASVRQHPRIALDGVRLNAETDSVNSALLAPDGSGLDVLVREVVREMTSKSGQKCTAIRRIFVPQALYDTVAQAIAAKLAGIVVGDPRLDDVRMGSLVSQTQYQIVQQGIAQLADVCDVLYDGSKQSTLKVNNDQHACALPMLFGVKEPDSHPLAHQMEVFGPVATLMPYRDAEHAFALARRGQGSLVASVYGEDDAFLAQAARQLAESHGRVHLVNASVAKTHTGHGNAMPQSNHGGPGRAGGGQELGNLRALALYHRYAAIQAPPSVLAHLQSPQPDG